MRSRTAYHREYYRKNIHKRRRQRVESKWRCKWREETNPPGSDPELINQLMRSWT